MAKADLSLLLAGELTRRVWPDLVGWPENKDLPLFVEAGEFRIVGSVADITDLERVINKTYQLNEAGRIATATLWLRRMAGVVDKDTGLMNVRITVKWTAR